MKKSVFFCFLLLIIFTEKHNIKIGPRTARNSKKMGAELGTDFLLPNFEVSEIKGNKINGNKIISHSEIFS